MTIDRKKLIMVTILAGSMGLAAIGITRAQTAPTTTSATVNTEVTTADDVDQPTAVKHTDPALTSHIGTNGETEELLTGDALDKATAAASAAVPGGTILRLETDAEGATYEAHMTKADGSPVTIKMDANYKVTGTETGVGHPAMMDDEVKDD